MPIMSFSISEELKKVIQRLVNRNKSFKNQSNLVRTALNHYLNSDEGQIDIDDTIDSSDYKIKGQVFLSFKSGENENKITKNILNCEGKYEDSIESYQLLSPGLETNTCVYTFYGSIFDFRAFVDELDSIQNVEQLRYIINS